MQMVLNSAELISCGANVIDFVDLLRFLRGVILHRSLPKCDSGAGPSRPGNGKYAEQMRELTGMTTAEIYTRMGVDTFDIFTQKV